MKYSRPTRSLTELDRQRMLIAGANPETNSHLPHVLGKPAPKLIVDTEAPAILAGSKSATPTATGSRLSTEQQVVADANRKAREEVRTAAATAQALGVDNAHAEANKEHVAPVKGTPAIGHVVKAVPVEPATGPDKLLT